MPEPAKYHPRDAPSRDKVLGITQRATPIAFSWAGEMRVRFSDFQVNEIGLDGKVVHLRTVGLTEEQKQAEGVTGREDTEVKPAEAETAPAQEIEKPKPPVEAIEVAPEDFAILTGLAGNAFAQELVDIFREAQTADPEQRVKPITSAPIDDKWTRGQIHQEVRRIFQSRIDTTTDGSGGIVATAIRDRPRGKKRNRAGNGTQQRDGNRERKDNNRPAAEYLHFTLYKDNRDTMDAVTQIARMIRSKPQSIGYAGTKDRRASTAQRCSIRYTHQRSLAGLNGNLWGISTGDYEYRDEGIHLGQLLGNEFVITLKNCKVVDDAGGDSQKSVAERLTLLRSNVGAALEHMAAQGWINYFGHQRFGTHHIGTHEIGKLILGDRYEDAVNALLTYDSELAAKYEAVADEQAGGNKTNMEELARHHACMLFRTGKDPSRAASMMPRRFAAEVCVTRHLTRGGASSMRDYVGSLTHITRGLRSMYMHAYQSHVWNHAASIRWERYGAKVIAGDLVIADDVSAPLFGGKDQDGDDIINPVNDDDDSSAPVRARPLTEEEAASGRYTIYDVVLPTPGYQVAYPDNDVGAFYDAFMSRPENGALDPRKMMRMRREFSLPGRYRKLMQRFLATPSIEFRTYADEKEQMHPTDLDVIKATAVAAADGVEPAAKKNKVGGGGGDDAVVNGESEAGVTKTAAAVAEKIAAIVKFQLGRSAYATVALRELMGDMQEE
ncbi:Pseudouridine synthase TruD, eukaryotic [Cordyceps fumosorosea ARSEF 2679]|uniref:Pseudouridine synthase TruD, eukaryotic n=1 Tax=Cordyceps fumosorosea (strain ARSEF 2679) TaxID=1081104 RepID=A0A167ZE24_CORFA|nr:Pseudouridine synthase TruD, eukaryotic [Cordyceps fumosorosea ARSEF 2679]OAA67396.1 Pseudouridine synthase TruD, eukaryotic [Cordyceps fumosorosea ARSEF 2679]